MEMIDPRPGRIVTLIRGSVGWIEIDNPGRHNALSLAMWQRLPDAVDELEADPAVRAIAVTGAGCDAFASGADISEFDVVRANAASSIGYETANLDAFAALSACAKPTIAVIAGFCLGGGLGIAAACDIRLCSDDACFSIPAGRLGLAYPPSAVESLVRLVGPARAADLFFTARRIGADEALRIGLADHVHPKAQLADEAALYLARVTSLAPLTLAAFKAAVRAAGAPDDAVLAGEAARLAGLCFDSADYEEGRAAFRERRDPVFSGS